MTRSALLLLALAFAITGCESKKKRCEKLAEHMESIAEKEGATSSVSGDYQMCMDDFSDAQIDCTMKATTTSGILACAK